MYLYSDLYSRFFFFDLLLELLANDIMFSRTENIATLTDGSGKCIQNTLLNAHQRVLHLMKLIVNQVYVSAFRYYLH